MGDRSKGKSRLQGSPAKPYAKPEPPPAPPEPVEVHAEPPDPLLQLVVPYPSPQNKPLCAVAKQCRHPNGWGCWQWNPDTREWTNIHKDSTATEPRLNGAVLECLQQAKERFTASTHCSDIIFRAAGHVISYEELTAVEWTPIEALAEAAPPPPDPPASEMELQAIRARLDMLEARVLSLEPSSSNSTS